MPGSRPLRVALVVLVVAVALAGTPGALGARSYGLDSPSAVDVPRTVVSGDGMALNLNKIARVSRGEPFVLRTRAPDDAVYRVELLNRHGMVYDISNRTLRGDDTTTFETDYLQPGSYIAVLYDHGVSQAALPVVVEGYDVAVDAPEATEAATDVTVSATTTRVSDAPAADRVELLVVDSVSKEVVVQRVMNATNDAGAYSTTVRLVDPGPYRLYVNVRGQRLAEGYQEVLGFSDPLTLSVTASSSPTTEDTSDAASTGSGTATRTRAEPPATTVPEGVITRTATAGPPTTITDSPTTALSVVFALLLAAGLGLLYWVRV